MFEARFQSFEDHADGAASAARVAALRSELARRNLTGFILRSVLPQAAAVIAREEHLQLSERDSLRVLDLLENPPAAPARLVRAAKAGSKLK